MHRNSTLRNIKIHCKYIITYGKQKEQRTHSSKSFSVFICQQKIELDEIMVSFDGTSLYITVPIDQALLIIEDLLGHDDKLADRTLLSPRQILDLLDILTTHHIFQIQWRFLLANRRNSNGKCSFSHCFRNLYAIIRDNSHHNSRPSSQSLGTPSQ